EGCAHALSEDLSVDFRAKWVTGSHKETRQNKKLEYGSNSSDLALVSGNRGEESQTAERRLKPPFCPASLMLEAQIVCLLAGVLAAVIAPEPGAGLTDKAIALPVGLAIPAAIIPAGVVVATVVIGVGIVIAEGSRGDRASGIDGGTGRGGRAA